jgi:hypothetical protein
MGSLRGACMRDWERIELICTLLSAASIRYSRLFGAAIRTYVCVKLVMPFVALYIMPGQGLPFKIPNEL